MKNENQDEDKHNGEDSLTVGKLVCTWYVGAIVGFAIGNLIQSDFTTAVIGAVIGATMSRIFKQYLLDKE